jgi:hypothetical protein
VQQEHETQPARCSSGNRAPPRLPPLDVFRLAITLELCSAGMHRRHKRLTPCHRVPSSRCPSNVRLNPSASRGSRCVRSQTISLSNSSTVERPDSETAIQPSSTSAQRNLTKTSFYIRPDQADKLDELAYNFKHQRGKRIDRQDIIRTLIDNSNLDQLLNLIH